MKPTIGRMVWYRTDGRNGLAYDLPAIVNCTWGSHPGDYPDGQQNPLPRPESLTHVHLTVFTPGGFGSQVNDKPNPDDLDWVGAPEFTPGSGTYVEWNVPQFDETILSDIGDPQVTARTWRWPVIR